MKGEMLPSSLMEELLESFQSECVGGYRDPAHQSTPDFDIYSYWVEDLMNRGMDAFRVRDYTAAAGFFKTLLDMQTSRFGEHDPESSQACLRYGLALLYDIPFCTGDSLLADLPLEANYLLCSDPNFVDAGDHMKGVSELNVERDEKRESLVWEQLFKAWNITGAQHNHTLEKLQTMCALGEAQYRLGEPNDNSNIYYEWALCMMKDLIADGLIETTDLRRAHIYFKMCLSIHNRRHPEEQAIQYCKLAINVCQERILMLVEQSDGCCKQKEMDLELTTKFCKLYEKKLENLQNSLLH